MNRIKILAGLVAGAALGFVLGSSNSFTARASDLAGFQPERAFTVIGTETEKVKRWEPGTLICFKGEKVKITVINKIKSDPASHGFTIVEYNVKEEIKRGESKTVEFTADKAGLFTIVCPLHPSHVGAQLLVLSH